MYYPNEFSLIFKKTDIQQRFSVYDAILIGGMIFFGISSSEIGFVVSCILLLIFLILFGTYHVFYKSLKFLWVVYAFIVVNSLMGFFRYPLWDSLRDVFYFVQPIVQILLGIALSKKFGKDRLILDIVLSGFLLGIFSIANWVVHPNSINSFSDFILNSYSPYSYPLCAILSFSFLRNCLGKKVRMFFTFFFVFLSLLLFSRISLVFLVIFFLFCVNWKKTKNKLEILVFSFFCFLLVFLFFKDYVSTVIAKIMNSFDEISPNHDWSNETNVVLFWRGFEVSCCISQWKQYSLFEQLFGCGFGKRIYVGIYTYLVNPGSTDGTIAFIHNGYFSALGKFGLSGILMYIIFFFCMIKQAVIFGRKNKNSSESKKLFLAIVVCYFASGFVAAGIFGDFSILPMGCLLGFLLEKENKRTLFITH